MRGKSLLGAVLFTALLAARLGAAPCVGSDTALCLNASRFQVSVHWQDTRGRSGDGHATSLTADTGYFWFFAPSNVELVVKVLDARSVNGNYWVFFGALSNVQYDLKVTDSVTGAVKTYHNPQNQFASVGDTGAFAGSLDAPPTQVTVDAEGSPGAPGSLEALQRWIDDGVPKASTKSTADFTPCVGSGTTLLVAGCRFEIQVSWQDSRGRTGEGQGVQLTDDTGYFWFFSDANVELMIKVLDARSVNGDFWVFFGALSNVQYQIVVTDRQTGEFRTYSNPQGTFASLGDTGAFQAGASMSVSLDDARAASDRFDGAGGTLTATGADGTQFVLTIPPDAIVFPFRITMTPVTRIDGLPIDGPLVDAVQIEPDGALLMEAADLKIVPPNPVALPGLAYFRYRAPGDSFTPYPGVAEVSGIEMPVNYLAGYGAARGTILSASTRRTAATASAGSLAPYIAQAGAIYQQHLDQALDYQDYLAQAYEIWRNAWGDVVSPALQALGNDCNPGEMESVFKMALEFRELDPETDPRWQGYSHAIFDSIHDSVLTCIDKAYQRCKANNDPTEVMLIQKLSTLLQRIGQVTDAEYADIVAKVDGCLRFELDFESGLTVTYSAAGVPVTERLKVRAITPLQLEASDKKFILKGSAPIAHEFVSVTAPPCSDTVATKPGTFNVERLDLGLFEEVTTPVSDSTEIRPAPRDQISVDMVYSPGNPQEQLTSTCPGPFGPITGTGSFTGVFAPFFAQLHPDEAIGQTDFIVIKWQPIRSGNIFATLTYDRSVSLSGVNTSEETFVTLKHTPQ